MPASISGRLHEGGALLVVGTRHTEIVRRAFDLFQAGNVEAVVALYHPDVEVGVPEGVDPPARSYVGVDTVRAYLQEVVDEGGNLRVDDLELVEVGERVIVHGRVAPPANMAMRWHFDFEDDLITRVVPREADWAVLGGRRFALAQVAEPPDRGTVEIRLSDGRSMAAPIAPELESCAAVQEPVLAYFEGDKLAGWYLPEHQEGMDLR